MKRLEKIKVLENYLIQEPENYRDSFKTDIYLFFNEDFSGGNPLLGFMDSFNDQSEIENWVDFVTSQIVLKFDEEVEPIGDFIGEYLQIK
jgi:hypothetical protein